MKKRTRILLVAALVPAVVLGVAAPMALASGGSQRGMFDRFSLAAGMKGANEVPPVSHRRSRRRGLWRRGHRSDRGRGVCRGLRRRRSHAPLILFHIHRGVARCRTGPSSWTSRVCCRDRLAVGTVGLRRRRRPAAAQGDPPSTRQLLPERPQRRLHGRSAPRAARAGVRLAAIDRTIPSAPPHDGGAGGPHRTSCRVIDSLPSRRWSTGGQATWRVSRSESTSATSGIQG